MAARGSADGEDALGEHADGGLPFVRMEAEGGVDASSGGYVEGLLRCDRLVEDDIAGGGEPEAAEERLVVGEGAINEGADALGGGADVRRCGAERVHAHPRPARSRTQARQTALQTVVRPKSGRPRCLRAAWLRQAFWHPLHADVFIASHDRLALLRICRYMARPPIPQDRLSWRPDGKLVMSLKRTWKGGVKAVVFEPLALIARLAALVPTPYMHLRRFYGIFAPNRGLRAHIVPTPPDPQSAAAPVAPKRPKSMSWADLLMRVWRIDALRCPYCGGRMRVICAIRNPDAITAILAAVDAKERTDGARDPPPRAPEHHTHAA